MYQGRETKARLKKVKNDKKKAKRRQKVVAFSRCSCAQRVAGRLAGIELDGSSPGNRIFYLSRARTPPPSLHTHSLFVHSSFSIPLFLSLSLSSVLVLLSRSLCALTLSSISSSVIIALSLSLFLSISLVLTLKSRSSSTSHHIHTGSTSAFSLSLSICRLATPCILRERAEDSLIYIPWPMTLGRPRNDLHRRVSKIRKFDQN